MVVLLVPGHIVPGDHLLEPVLDERVPVDAQLVAELGIVGILRAERRRW